VLQDANLDDTLRKYDTEQNKGAWLNELCEKHYKLRPRSAKSTWPHTGGTGQIIEDLVSNVRFSFQALHSTRSRRGSSESGGYYPYDKRLRRLLQLQVRSGADLVEKARKDLRIVIKGPTWMEADAALTKNLITRPPMAVVFLIDRTDKNMLNACVNAVKMVFTDYLEDFDMVGYRGLGDKDWNNKGTFPITLKSEGMAPTKKKEQTLLQKIESSAQKAGSPTLYTSIEGVLEPLMGTPEQYSKWLIVLTDLFDSTPGEKLANKEAALLSKQKASEETAQRTLQKLNQMEGLSVVLINARKIANYQPNNPMWTTWEKNADALLNGLDSSKRNSGFPVKVQEVGDIRPAFEFIACDLMSAGGAEG